MTKIIGRLGNMNYFVAWNHWHTVTIKDAQKRAKERIRELKKQLKECKKKTEEFEAEAQRRADEAAALAFGAATDSQKKLIWKILTRLSTLKVRLFWGHWYKQTFGAKLQKLLMIKILKRMMHSFLNKGFGMWRYVTQQWELIKKLELKARTGVLIPRIDSAPCGASARWRARGESPNAIVAPHTRGVTATPSPPPRLSRAAPAQDQLVKELKEKLRLAKKYKDDAEERQNQAASAAFNRATGAQKDMMIKILSKLTGQHVDAQLQGLEAQERRVHSTI